MAEPSRYHVAMDDLERPVRVQPEAQVAEQGTSASPPDADRQPDALRCAG